VACAPGRLCFFSIFRNSRPKARMGRQREPQ
jgi:hypothetical protein